VQITTIPSAREPNAPATWPGSLMARLPEHPTVLAVSPPAREVLLVLMAGTQPGTAGRGSGRSWTAESRLRAVVVDELSAGAVEGNPAAERLHAVLEADQTGAAGEVGLRLAVAVANNDRRTCPLLRP
jgi:hypothetical protein